MEPETDLGFVISDEKMKDFCSFMTEFAKIQRAVDNNEKADRAEVIRNDVYSQQAQHL